MAWKYSRPCFIVVMGPWRLGEGILAFPADERPMITGGEGQSRAEGVAEPSALGREVMVEGGEGVASSLEVTRALPWPAAASRACRKGGIVIDRALAAMATRLMRRSAGGRLAVVEREPWV